MTKLFSPLRIGDIEVKHRVVLAPLTRYRADESHVPLNFVRDYYTQRASTPGTILITEGTFISPRAGGFKNVPGIYNNAQIDAWKSITDSVHANGCFIFCQLWALGRAANPDILKAGGHKLISSGSIPMSGDAATPEPLTESEIQGFIQDYAQAAKNAIRAGFDGVEIHGANGYLCDQFLQDKSNNRTDGWGGSVEKRSRFGLEVAKAVSAAVGPGRTGYRVSPWSPFQGMGMDDPRPQFSYHAQQLSALNIAYLHVVESRISGSNTIECRAEQIDFLVDIFGTSGTVIVAGGFTPGTAAETTDRYADKNVAVAFGRSFLANPDLPFRIQQHIPLTKYDRSTFYVPESRVGYIDYPFSEEYKNAQTCRL
ncbi:hypothetical protein W97_05555 [Coniosporium apollinis CBS 100218]|uniref:NADH:flavin oxidoreductase/NADH oxidase N-terminal domain-containing protein n=1 Tax=Coniosporium apollinis (strain CBS 100218) TaxID=1168221 RepID=R7YX26_CONA1|nr:uncharacterized protein W97_05555 [Coniosporium apollinis CBS 100218]EON66457.1 hypothetical protein W97_05555 [Coniosporium apollinis CBS 100218]